MSSSTVETMSTDSWVSARSGAENPKKVSEAATPTTPTSTTVWKRWWCVNAIARHVTSSSAHTAQASGVAGICGRSPVPMPLPTSGKAPSTSAVSSNQPM